MFLFFFYLGKIDCGDHVQSTSSTIATRTRLNSTTSNTRPVVPTTEFFSPSTSSSFHSLPNYSHSGGGWGGSGNGNSASSWTSMSTIFITNISALYIEFFSV